MEINNVRTNITFTPEKCLLGADNPVIVPHSKAFQTHLQPPPGPEQKHCFRLNQMFVKLEQIREGFKNPSNG